MVVEAISIVTHFLLHQFPHLLLQRFPRCKVVDLKQKWFRFSSVPGMQWLGLELLDQPIGSIYAAGIGVWSPNNHRTKLTNTFSVASCVWPWRSIHSCERKDLQASGSPKCINILAITINKNWQMVLYTLELQEEMYDCVLEDKHGQRMCDLLFLEKGLLF